MSKIYNMIAKAVADEKDCVIGGKLYLAFTEEYIYVYSFDDDDLYEEARLQKSTYEHQNANYIKAILDNQD